MKNTLARLSLAVLALVTTYAQAVTPATADAVAQLVATTPVPPAGATDFQKWSLDTLKITASSCWLSAHPRGTTPGLITGGLSRSGTFQAPDDNALEAICTSLATQGFQPWCAASAVKGDKKQPDATISSNYLQLERFDSNPSVTGALYCYLNKGQKGQQFFTPTKVSARWVSALKRQSFMSARGERIFNAGTILIEVPTAPGIDGRPYVEPVTAVVPD